MAATAQLSVTSTTVRYDGKLHDIHKLEPMNSKQFLEVFKRYDSNGNGSIDKRELDQLIDDLLFLCIAQGKAKEVKKQLLKNYDSNHDGKISLTELAKIVPVDNYLSLFGLDHEYHVVDFMQIWFHYDEDNSGELDAEELKALLYDLLSRKQEDVTMKTVTKYQKVILEKYDKDHSSTISLSELLHVLPVEDNYMKQYGKWLNEEEFDQVFDHYDRDENGIIEGTEVYAFIKDLAEKNGIEPTKGEIDKFRTTVLDIFHKNENKITRPELRMVMLGR